MDFKTAYDMNFISMIDKDYQGITYVGWAYYTMFMKEHYPNVRWIWELSQTNNVPGVFINSYFYDNNSNQTSEEYCFAVMSNNNKAAINPDSVVVNKNIQRAYAKAIAREYGFTLRLWSRESVDLEKKGDCSHPVYRGLNAITNNCKRLNIPVDPTINFSTSLDDLRALNTQLKAQS